MRILHSFLFFVLIGVFVGCKNPPTYEQFDLPEDSHLPVLIIWPDVVSAVNQSVVVISPGYFDSALSQIVLGRRLADEGYIVIIPDYDDYVNLVPLPVVSNNRRWEVTVVNRWQEDWSDFIVQMADFGYILPPNLMLGRDWLEKAMGGSLLDDSQANEFFVDFIFGDRQRGLETILATMSEQSVNFSGPVSINPRQVVLVGHSIGGLSSLSVASGGNYQISAVVAMAPVSGPLSGEKVGDIEVPTLWLLASDDFGWINNPAITRSSYCSGEVIMVEGASHFTFSDLGQVLGGTINQQIREEIREEVVDFVLKNCPLI